MGSVSFQRCDYRFVTQSKALRTWKTGCRRELAWIVPAVRVIDLRGWSATVGTGYRHGKRTVTDEAPSLSVLVQNSDRPVTVFHSSSYFGHRRISAVYAGVKGYILRQQMQQNRSLRICFLLARGGDHFRIGS